MQNLFGMIQTSKKKLNSIRAKTHNILNIEHKEFQTKLGRVSKLFVRLRYFFHEEKRIGVEENFY